LIEAVIFDLDGTLITLPLDYEGELLPRFSKVTGIKDMHPLTEKVSKLDPKKKEKVFAIWNEAELKALEKMKVNSKGKALYDKHLDKPKALVTLQGKTVVKNILENMDLRFDLIVTREDSLSRNEQLQIALKKLHKPAQNVLFVGNTTGDSAAAKTVECQFLRVEQ
jgi:phosphoglycolate phosphatase-like HAD superfamily hydrolase